MFVEVCVNLTGVLEREVAVEVSTAITGDINDIAMSPAIGDADFVSVLTNLTFAASGRQCLNVELIVDQILERTEVFHVNLTSSDAAVNFTSSRADIVLLDSNRK